MLLEMAFILVFFCISKASASNIITFRPNCTRPPDGVNFVYNADARATLDILWSCLFTLLVCTWTVQHLNIPRQAILQSEKPPKGTIWQRFAAWAAKKWKSFIPKFKWMTLTLLLPEFSYRASDGVVEENELCPVYVCRLEGDPAPAPDEVAEWVWWDWDAFLAAAQAPDSVLSPWARLQAPLLDPLLDTALPGLPRRRTA